MLPLKLEEWSLKKKHFSTLPLLVSKESNLHGLTTFINSFISTPVNKICIVLFCTENNKRYRYGEVQLKVRRGTTYGKGTTIR